jgi:uncharacterized protein
LLTFPALTWALGDAPASLIVANATSTIALCPGSLSSAWAYRKELAGSRQWLVWLLPPSLLGAVLGTGWLLYDQPETFKSLIPWLILLATVLFALQPTLSRWLLQPSKGASAAATDDPASTQTTTSTNPQQTNHWRMLGLLLFQFGIGLYGGYFGAGIGILILSTLGLLGLSDIHQMNALKTLLATTINMVAIVLFLGQDIGLLPPSSAAGLHNVDWQRGLPMIVGGIIGGYGGARIARRLNRQLVRQLVVLIGVGLAIIYFYRTWV